ncbi:MAG: ArnT family glycosyltransferase [Gaiellaceae bacterium]
MSFPRARTLFAAAFLGALLLRLDAVTTPPLDFAAVRQYHSALLARVYFLDDSSALPAWKARVVDATQTGSDYIEPPILEFITAGFYHLAGGEHLWIPRVLSSVFWLAGGLFLYLIARRTMTRMGAGISLVLYLYLPFGIVASRSFQPDPLLIALLLAGLFAVLRYYDRPTGSRLVVATGVCGLGGLTKPGISLPFVCLAFLALAVSRDGLRAAVSARATLFALGTVAPSTIYYLYGTYADDFLRGQAAAKFMPELLSEESFWRGWARMATNVLAYPSSAGTIGLAVLGAALLGVLFSRGLEARAMLLGLWSGYALLGLVFTFHISTHDYYSLPLIPIVALSLGALGSTIERQVSSRRVRLILVGAGLLAVATAAWKTHTHLTSQTYEAEVKGYEAIGTVTRHTTQAVFIDREYGTPLSYHGWLAGEYWYWPNEQQNVPMTRAAVLEHFRTRLEGMAPEFLIVTATEELEREQGLRAFIKGLPIVTQTARYSVFALTEDAPAAVDFRAALR